MSSLPSACGKRTQVAMLWPVSGTQIRKCLESMPLKKLRIDRRSLRALLQMPHEGLSGLAWLLQRVERDLQDKLVWSCCPKIWIVNVLFLFPVLSIGCTLNYSQGFPVGSMG